jgi:hypothetical protein
MRRAARLVLPFLALALVGAGCGAERPEQQGARSAVEAHLAGADGYEGTVRCTRNPRPWLVPQQSRVFICAARRDDGDCDWYRVSVPEGTGTVAVTLDRARGGCVVPL